MKCGECGKEMESTILDRVDGGKDVYLICPEFINLRFMGKYHHTKFVERIEKDAEKAVQVVDG